MFIYDLGLDYHARSPQLIASVDRAAVLSVARKYLASGKMIVIAVGDRTKIEPDLRALNLGPIEIRDADGNVKPQS